MEYQKSITEIGYKRVAENNLYEIFDKLMFATDGDISSTFGKIRNKLDATQKKWISQGEKDNLEEISRRCQYKNNVNLYRMHN